MHRYYLRFVDKAHADSVISNYKNDVMNVAIYVIGTIYEQIATDRVDDDKNVIYEPVAKDGYHINIISRFEIEFDKSVMVAPERPLFNFA